MSAFTDARPHPGQQAVARASPLASDAKAKSANRIAKNDPRVQDAYSLRCMPQVHGAVRGALAHCEEILAIESGSATDNPLVFTDNGDVLSGGNFHGAPLALALDYAAIAMTDLMSISERRIDRLVNPDLNEGLPAFLARNPGHAIRLHDRARRRGRACSTKPKFWRIRRVSIICRLPAGKEDHVSMGMTGALKLRTIVENAENVIAIELLAGAEGIGISATAQSRRRGRARLRRVCAQSRRALTKIASLSADIERVAEAIRDGEFDSEDENL